MIYTMSPRLRALIWAAVSSKPQAEKDSLSEQLADGRAYADRVGWTVVGDLSVPGHTRDMPAYADLQRLAGERAFDVLICRGRDRLGRTDALITQVEAIVERAGAQVLSLAMPAPIGVPADRGSLYVAAIERAGAQAEVVELVRRHRSGMHRVCPIPTSRTRTRA
jgi:DNA invertase Pin-like site-specific DNA recombinase